MGNHEKSCSAELYELTPDQAVDVSDQAFKALRTSLEKIEAMKKDVAEGILKAKKKNMTEHVEKFRAILCELVVMENALLEEQDRKEASKLALELDALAEECRKELPSAAAENVSHEIESKHSLKAIRYGIAARLLGFGGVFTFLLGCIAYLILVQTTIVNLSFSWILPALSAVGVLLFTMIGLSLNKKRRYYLHLAQEDSERIEAERVRAQQKLAAEASNIAMQAYALEWEMENRENEQSEQSKEEHPDVEEITQKRGKLFLIKKVKRGKTEGVQDGAKGASVLVLTAALVGTAAITAAFLAGKRFGSDKKAKKTENKESATQKGTPRLQGFLFRIED